MLFTYTTQDWNHYVQDYDNHGPENLEKNNKFCSHLILSIMD